jgi:hypothetical protein
MKRLIIASLIVTFLVAFSIGNANAAPIGPVYIQVTGFTDCYEMYFDDGDLSAYGNVAVYPTIFSGMLWYFSAAYWEIGVGEDVSGTHFLTVFFNNQTLNFYQITGGANRQLVQGNVPWTIVGGCAVSDGGPTLAGD